MGRVFATLGAVLVLALIACGLAEVTLAYGHGVGQDYINAPRRTAPSTTTPSPRSTPTPTPQPTPLATPAVPAASTATTNSFVHMRAGMSTTAAIVLNLNADSVVTLESGGDTLWQEVVYDGYQGYVYKSYLSY